MPLPRLMDDVTIWAAAMAGAVLALLVWRVLVVLVALLLGLGLVGGATAWGFSGAGLLLPGVPVALAWVLSAAGCNFVMHSVGLRERTQLRRSFESYLDPRIISQMMQGDTLPSFGGEHREITAYLHRHRRLHHHGRDLGCRHRGRAAGRLFRRC